jgi:hypothetical protein
MAQPQSVALNDVADLIRLLRDGGLRDLLSESLITRSCGTDCTCNDSKCGCRGTVVAVAEEALSPLELEELKQKRIRELRRQIQEAEQQIADVAPAVHKPATPRT